MLSQDRYTAAPVETSRVAFAASSFSAGVVVVLMTSGIGRDVNSMIYIPGTAVPPVPPVQLARTPYPPPCLCTTAVPLISPEGEGPGDALVKRGRILDGTGPRSLGSAGYYNPAAFFCISAATLNCCSSGLQLSTQQYWYNSSRCLLGLTPSERRSTASGGRRFSRIFSRSELHFGVA